MVDITDTGGRVWRVTSNTSMHAIRRPGASADTTSAARNSTTGVVTSATKEGVTTGYSRSVSGTTATMSVTNALRQAATVVSDATLGRTTSVTDPLSRTTSFQYDGYDRLTRTTLPEGNHVELTYDARGNVTQSQAVAKPGSGLAAITTSASYDASCSNPRTCNQPNSTTDARCHVTGKRIRDKGAASKARGMWMGGLVPLGYEVRDRKLVVVPEDAATVRMIFERYLELGSVLVLAENLASAGIRSRARISRAGKCYGNAALSRGALYLMLRNQIYVGKILTRAPPILASMTRL